MEHGPTRRQIIRTGAVAGGLVWAAPAVKTAGRLGQVGSPRPTPSSTLPPEETSTSTSTLSTTTTIELPDVCVCQFTVLTSAGRYICEAVDPADCDCLCSCGGAPDQDCVDDDPCSVGIVCTPVGGGASCSLWEAVGRSPRF